MAKIRTYKELSQLQTFEERYEYLKLGGIVGERTFGFDRWVNQGFYHSGEWRIVKRHVIVRDQGCDLGVPGYELYQDLLVHHMNPFGIRDLEENAEKILDPEFLITTSLRTHNAIHYGDASQLPKAPTERKRGDTKLW
jgi:hypothetical protein